MCGVQLPYDPPQSFATDSRRCSAFTRKNRMATVGLVGGLRPESTIDYYRRILGASCRSPRRCASDRRSTG